MPKTSTSATVTERTSQEMYNLTVDEAHTFFVRNHYEVVNGVVTKY